MTLDIKNNTIITTTCRTDLDMDKLNKQKEQNNQNCFGDHDIAVCLSGHMINPTDLPCPLELKIMRVSCTFGSYMNHFWLSIESHKCRSILQVIKFVNWRKFREELMKMWQFPYFCFITLSQTHVFSSVNIFVCYCKNLKYSLLSHLKQMILLSRCADWIVTNTCSLN